MNKRKLKIIVSIDGGGIRGILPLMILNHLEQLMKANDLGDCLSEKVDLIAGTSTGAIISAGLIVKNDNQKHIYSIQDLLNLYIQRGPQLFNLANPSNPGSEGLKLVLKRKFKNLLLSDLDTQYAFVSHDVITHLPYVFGRYNHSLSRVELSTALAACSAVPGYFPSVKVADSELIDGVVSAKNPALIALEHTQIYYPNQAYLLLSFGTGDLTNENFDEIERKVNEVDDLLSEKAEINDNLIYYRFQPEIITAAPEMDNASPENIDALIADGKTFIEHNKVLFDSVIANWKQYS
ncbi:patatin-like phospholipase family protein [Brumimicrobium aurantiacum]|uniref:PNPLA domain-containing protein n=1 Tax=Brumimicrobium aurantiacum TaxID=1737063 RepID=A0A3E1EW88_9FLAO|nr:patatin-like phospholipase family protein [Brumimicrobium aurantiacum]RFC53820.1 hypothetical protein DXU93_11885 [Brumimicrobium aurantiacum]